MSSRYKLRTYIACYRLTQNNRIDILPSLSLVSKIKVLIRRTLKLLSLDLYCVFIDFWEAVTEVFASSLSSILYRRIY